MEKEGERLAAEGWGSFEQPELKLISIIAERDAAVLERNIALAEKKAVCSERDAALLQRDLAFADRNSAIMERDAAMDKFEYAKNGHFGGITDVSAKLQQVLAHNSDFSLREVRQNLHPLVPTSTALILEEPQKQIKNSEGQKHGTPRRKLGRSTVQAPRPVKQRKRATGCEGDDSKSLLIFAKHEWKGHDDDGIDDDNDEKSEGSIDISAMVIPACSCTGVLQQCYRWGNGGWQSACCTNNVSMYPLPMNPKKKGVRVPGRKMSGGAFRKLLRRLSSEGHNLSQPIDLKNHWARHGTNRYVTFK